MSLVDSRRREGWAGKEATDVRHPQAIVHLSIMAVLAIILAAGCGSNEGASDTANSSADASHTSNGAGTGGQSGQRDPHSAGDV
jgi:hypothetical protein